VSAAPLDVPARGHVDVWRVALDERSGPASTVVLSEDERERAGRFRFERDRAHYAVARAALRTILGSYLDIAPDRLAFEYTAHGKPSLRDAPVSFNLSHSGDIALVAVAGGAAVGVDVEQVRDDIECERLARRFFSDREQAELFALESDVARVRAFFTCWTRKEAFIKGVGEGLSIPLADFDVPVVAGQPARLLAFRTDESAAARWSIADVPVPEGYAAAVALESRTGCCTVQVIAA